MKLTRTLAALLILGACAKKAEPEPVVEEARTGPALDVEVSRATWTGERGTDARGSLLVTVAVTNNLEESLSFEGFSGVISGGDEKVCSGKVEGGSVGAGKTKELSVDASACAFAPLNGKATVRGKIAWSGGDESGEKKFKGDVTF